MKAYRITHTYEVAAESDQEAISLADGMARNLRTGIDAATAHHASGWPTATVEEVSMEKCRIFHNGAHDAEDCWTERARDAQAVALLQD